MKKFTDKINESIDTENVPTANELFAEYHGFEADNSVIDIINLMIKFAKIHVKEALRVAAYSAEIERCGNPYDPTDDSQSVSEKSIIESYPLENIK